MTRQIQSYGACGKAIAKNLAQSSTQDHMLLELQPHM